MLSLNLYISNIVHQDFSHWDIMILLFHYTFSYKLSKIISSFNFRVIFKPANKLHFCFLKNPIHPSHQFTFHANVTLRTLGKLEEVSNFVSRNTCHMCPMTKSQNLLLLITLGFPIIGLNSPWQKLFTLHLLFRNWRI